MYNWKVCYTAAMLATATIKQAEKNFVCFKKAGMTKQCRAALGDAITLKGIMQDVNLARRTTDLLNYLAVCGTAV